MQGSNVIDFQHTFVPDAQRGKGVAEQIAETVLKYARDHNLKVKASYRFMSVFIKRNKQYQDLL